METEQMLVVLSGEGPRVSCQLNPSIHVGANDEISLALTKITFYNSFPNIQEDKNNCIKITPGKGTKSLIVKIPAGAYEITQISNAIVQQLIDVGHKDAKKHFKLEPNLATLKSVITLSNAYIVDFNVDYSIASLLGFKKTKKLIGGDGDSEKRFEGENIVNITNISSLLVMCDVVKPSFLNGRLTSFIHNCILDVEPGVKYIEKPINLTFLNAANNVIPQISCWLVSNNMQEVDFRHEELEIELKLIIRRAIATEMPSRKRWKRSENFD